MKRILFFMMAIAMIALTGCRKKDDGTTEVMSKEEVAEKTHDVAKQTTEKAAQVTQQAEEAVSAIAVKAEDVMSDLNQSVQAIKERVAEFDKTQLLAYVDQYKTVILEKKDQIAALTEQIKAIPMTEMMGNKTLALKEQLGKYTQEFNALKERYTVYLDKLKEYGVDLSSYTL